MLKKAVKWTVIASGVGAVLSIGLTVSIARTFQVEDAGTVFSFLAYAMVLAQIFAFGFPGSIIRYLTANIKAGELIRDYELCIFKRILSFVSVSMLLAVIGVIAAEGIVNIDGLTWFFGVFFSALMAIRLCLVAFFRVQGLFLYTAIVGSFLFPTTAIGFLWLLFASSDSLAVFHGLISLFIAQLATTLIAVALWYLNGGAKSTKSNVIFNSKNFMKYSSSLFVNALLISVFAQLGVMLLSIIGDDEDVAIFSVAARLIATIGAPIVILLQYLSPIISCHVEGGRINKLKHVMTAASGLSLLYYFILILFFYLIGDYILEGLFGELYIESLQPLIIMLLGYGLSCGVGFGMKVLEMGGRPDMARKSGLAGLFVGFIFAFLLYGIWGVNGVAVGIALGVISNRLCALVLVKKIYGLSTAFDPIYAAHRAIRTIR